MENFKDESFISQYLSPKLIRDFKLFHIHDDSENNYVEIGAIHNAQGYKKVRQNLANQYNLSNLEVNIQIIDANVDGDRALTLRYTPHNGVGLGDSKNEVLKHLHYLWHFDVKIVQENKAGVDEIIASCPAIKKDE
jgi:spore cortex formation protein SpoVR/YcgB (stage V sporulation)